MEHLKKRLGQYFLVDKNVLKKIIDAADLQKDDIVLEIGPGTGVLTFELAKYVKKVLAVEKDKELAEVLKNNLKQQKINNVEVIISDILKIDWKLKIGNWKLIGNIPFYITGYLLRIIGELPQKPKLIVLTIQKEVAERIIAQPPRMNMLAVSVQIWAKPEIVSFVSRAAFKPQPKVDSAIIKLTPLINIRRLNLRMLGLVKAGFKQPRKLLINNLANFLGLKKEDLFKIFKKLGLKDKARAQDLSIEDWQRLASGLTPIKVI